MRTGNIDGLINDLYQVVYDSGELSDVASLSITGLDGNTDKEYKLIARVVGYDSGGSIVRMQFNSDTGANYGFQAITGDDSTASAARTAGSNGWDIAVAGATGYLSLSEVDMYVASGYERTGVMLRSGSVTGTTVTNVQSRGHTWNNTADNITSIGFSEIGGSGYIGAGSRFILLKKVDGSAGTQTGALDVEGEVEGAWEKIWSSDITSATTQLTAGSLTGNTDVVYKIVVRLVGAGAGNYLYLRPNATLTDIVGSQKLVGVDTTVSSARDTPTSAIQLYNQAITDGEIINCEILMYAKSGYERTAIAKCAVGIDGTTVDSMELWGYAYNDTSTEITSFRFDCNTSGIGIGSHFELWRLNL